MATQFLTPHTIIQLHSSVQSYDMSNNDSISYSPVPQSEQTPRPTPQDLDSSDPVSEAPPGYFMGPFLPWSKDITFDESSVRIIDEIITREGTIDLADSEIAMEVTIVIPSDGENDEEEPEGLSAATSTFLPPFRHRSVLSLRLNGPRWISHNQAS